VNKLLPSKLSPLVGLLVILLASLPAAKVAHAAPVDQSRQIWGCGAENSKRRYVVDQLNRADNSFDIAIYQGTQGKGDDSDYSGTVRVDVTQKDPTLVGHGQTSNGTLNVAAFGRSTIFTVEDKIGGSASGRCFVQWQMADASTRRLVRQCLALATRKSGGLAEVERYACTADPRNYIEELKRPR